MDEIMEIIEHLKNDEVRNINMINFIENYPIHFAEKIDNSTIIKGTSDRKWVYISSESTEELQVLKQRLTKEDMNFAIVEQWMIPILFSGRQIKDELTTMKLFLPREIELEYHNFDTTELKLADAEFIYESSDYKEYISIEYIKERISRGISSCTREGDRPVAWAITQDDGAIGFLHVLPEYRKRGYGRCITLDMINKVRLSGKLPFVHIEEENEKSMNLAIALGFNKDRVISWIELE